MKKVTIRMVAETAGVSHTTVSRVLNNAAYVSHTTRHAVIRAARELGYLETGSGRRTVALVLPRSLSGGYMEFLLTELRNELSLRNYHAELIASDDIGILNDRSISGGISLTIDDDRKQWKELKNLPLVQINRFGDHLNRVYCVRSDGIQAMELAVEHLCRHGHSRIAYVANVPEWKDKDFCSRRYDGFIAAMRRLGNPAPRRNMFFMQDSWDFRDMKRSGITAIICGGELTGLSVLRQIRLQGMDVPVDFSLVGMEYCRVSEQLYPALTTLEQNYKVLARQAIGLLNRLIQGLTPEGDISVPYKLIERESVRVPDGTTRNVL